MAMVVKNNMSAISTLNTLNKNSAGLSKSLAKVSSGQRVNGAADDASGYAISERMRVQVRALDQDNRNTQSGTSMMKVAEGAVSSTVDILKTLKEKVVSAANDDKTDSDRAAIQKELDQSIDQINDNANVTFNGKYLVDGSHNNKVKQGGTVNTMTNESLDATTSYDTKFELMKDRNGNSLNIRDTDTVTISFVKEGRTYEASVKGSDNFQNLLDAANSTQGTVGREKLDAGDFINTGATHTFGTGSNQTTVGLVGSNKQIENLENALKSALQAGASADNTTITAGKVYADVKFKLGDNATFASVTGQEFGTNPATAPQFAAGDTLSVSVSNISFEDSGHFKFDATISNGSGASLTATGIDGGAFNTSGFITELNAGSITGLDKVAADTTVAAVKSDSTKFSYRMESARVYAAGDAVFDVHKDDTKIGDATGDEINIGTSAYIGKDRSDLDVKTADEGNAITFTSANKGTQGQIAGITIKVEDQYGVINKSANAVLDNFSESIRAEDQSTDNAIVLQVGAKANQAIKVGLTDMRAEALGLRAADGTNIKIGTQKQANAAINVLDNAISKALDQQTTIGSVESRLEYTSQNLTTASENVTASESTIRDADMAKEMTEYTKNNVLLQAAQSMLAQANQNSSAVLSLLQ